MVMCNLHGCPYFSTFFWAHLVVFSFLTLSTSGDLQPTPATLDTIKQQFQQGNFGPM